MTRAGLRIDVNCDMGEFPEAVADGTQEALMRYISSVNIACGGHAGDEHTMRLTVEEALRTGVAIGAHPGYADRANFGRRELNLSVKEVTDSVFQQVSSLLTIAAQCGACVTHVKPHGALYNQAARDRALAAAIARGVAESNKNLILVGLAGSSMLEVFRDAGFAIAAEAFADRRYQPDGSLRPRKFADALISDPAEAARQALRIVQRGTAVAVDGSEVPVHAATICIHSDSPGAREIAATIARTLQEAEISLATLSPAR
ncbi:MAG: 5-oxoprolinase subunit PxpA [Candidatus Acidiferrum sp.]|jgi:UPF0271 protein